MLPGWVELPEFLRDAAAKAGVSQRTIRRRVLAVNHAAGGGIVRSFQSRGPVRLWWVNPERLRVELERDPDARDAQAQWLEARIEKLEENVEALKTWRRALKRRGFLTSSP